MFCGKFMKKIKQKGINKAMPYSTPPVSRKSALDANLMSMAVGNISIEMNASSILKIPALVCNPKILNALMMRTKNKNPIT